MSKLRRKPPALLQIVWLLLVGLLLVSFSFGIPVRYRSLQSIVDESDYISMLGISPSLEAFATSRLNQQEADALLSYGISLKFYATYILAFDLALALISILIGILIFWRKSNDWMAVWVSFILILLGTNGASLVIPSLAIVLPAWILISYLFGFLGMVSNVHLLFYLPDGRYVPGWTKTVALGFTGIMLGVAVYASIDFMGSGAPKVTIVLLSVMPVWFGLSFLGILTQVYRYLRVSDRTQRQQTKWVAFGLIPVTLGFLINGFILYAGGVGTDISPVLLNLVRAPLVNFCFAFFPVCLAISVLRYRLWDIDLIIRRTLQYSLLTGLLSGIYFGGVALLSAVGGQASSIVIVVTTLLIYILFNPLRRRIQAFIDRRFYRQKYDAEVALAQFSQAARSQTDLDQLSSSLVDTVQEALLPQMTSLWIIPPPGMLEISDQTRSQFESEV